MADGMSTNTPTSKSDRFFANEQDGDSESSHCLNDLAKLIVAASKQQITPVLVTDQRLRFTSDFYIELSAAVHRYSGCHVRYEWLPAHRLGDCNPSITGIFKILGGHKTDAQRLSHALPSGCSAIRTLALARNQHPLSELVIGCAGPNDHLPSYAKSIELCT